MSVHLHDALRPRRAPVRARSRVVAAAALATVLTPPPAGASPSAAGVARPTLRATRHVLRRLAPRGTATPTPGALVDHGGRVLPNPHVYAIWWGPASGFPADAVSGLTTFFNGLSGSGYLKIAQQYLRGAAVSSSPVTNLSDPGRPPAQVTAASLGAEVGRLTKQKPDPLGIYFVFATNFPTGANYCAWHDAATVGGRRVAVAYMPNVSLVAGCDGGNQFGLHQSAGTRALASVTAHELMEAVTDADPSSRLAWVDASDQEIGDKCAWMFASPVTLSNGSKWQLQEQWSNSAGGCVQG